MTWVKASMLIVVVLFLCGCTNNGLLQQQQQQIHDQELGNITSAVDSMREADTAAGKFEIEYDIATADNLDSQVKVNRAIEANSQAREYAKQMQAALLQLESLPNGTSQNYTQTVAAITACANADNQSVVSNVHILDNSLKYALRENISLLIAQYVNNESFEIQEIVQQSNTFNDSQLNQTIDQAIDSFTKINSLIAQETQIYALDSDQTYITWLNSGISMMNQLKEYAADPYSQTSIQFAQNFSQIEIDFDKVGKTADDQHETQMEQWHEDNIVTPNTNLTTENVDAAQICQSARQKMKDNFDVSIVI